MTEVDIKLSRKSFNLKVNEQFTDGITGIFGPSGSGKTSMLHAIAGLEIPEEGKITVSDRVLYDRKKKIHVPVNHRNIGYVFQEGRLFPHLNVENNLLYGYKNRRINKVGFDEVVELLNLKHILKSKPSQISGGERQRTALGRSLLSAPEIMLLDEPFSAVDTNLRKQILPFIIKIQEKYQMPILVVSHDLPDLLKLTSRICVIDQGKVIGHEEYYELLKKPEISDLFGAGSIVNSIDVTVDEVMPDSGLTIMSYEHDNNKTLIRCEKSKDVYVKDQRIKLFINADDIALSKTKIDNVTIQNQIEGVIQEIIIRDGTSLCVVDCGFKLVVEITAQSQKRMEIIKGSIVCCLFKSVAIDVAG